MGVSQPVLLFDVDGTLVSAPGAGRRALERALATMCGIDGEQALRAIRFDGMTDRLILREAFSASGMSFSEEECLQVLGEYATVLCSELTSAPLRVLPGVHELLEGLAAAGAVVGLGTGNVRAGAEAKLRRGGIDQYFRFGGFGEDGETREDVLRAALERGGAMLGRRVGAAEALVIGDTPRDIEAARAVGCRSLAVATGRYTLADLRAAGPDDCVATLVECTPARWGAW